MKSFFALAPAFSLIVAPFVAAVPSIGAQVQFLSETIGHPFIGIAGSPFPHPGSPVILTAPDQGNFTTFSTPTVGLRPFKQIKFFALPRFPFCMTARGANSSADHGPTWDPCDANDLEQRWLINDTSPTTIPNSQGQCITVFTFPTIPDPIQFLTLPRCNNTNPAEQLWTQVS